MMDPAIGMIIVLAIGTVRTVVSDALVILALAAIVVTGVGISAARSPVTRLHFLAPASTIALPLFGIGAIINQGLTLGSAAIAVSVIAGALSAPVLTTSIARLVAAEESDDARDMIGEESAEEAPG